MPRETYPTPVLARPTRSHGSGARSRRLTARSTRSCPCAERAARTVLLQECAAGRREAAARGGGAPRRRAVATDRNVRRRRKSMRKGGEQLELARVDAQKDVGPPGARPRGEGARLGLAQRRRARVAVEPPCRAAIRQARVRRNS